MCGGSSASGTTKYEWNDDMRDRWNNALNTAEQTADVRQQMQQYNPNSRVAQFNADQNEGMNYTRNMARMNSSPVGSMRDANGNIGLNPVTGQPWGGAANDARLMIEDTLGGEYLSGAGSNPYAGAGNRNAYAGIVANPWTDQFRNNASIMTNQYAGQNPFFDQVLDKGMQKITNNYQLGTAADTNRAANLSGAFGGSAHQQMVANNQANLGEQLGNYYNQASQQQYDRSASLEDARLQRATGAEEGLLSRGNQSYQQMLDRGFQGHEANAGRGFQGFENERARQMQGIGLGQNEQNLAYQRIAAMMGIGDQQYERDQKIQDYTYQNWQDQQNFPFKLTDWLTSQYGRAMGGGGMNTTVYGGGNSGVSQGLGGLLGLATLFSGNG